jgi:integrase
MTSKKPQTRNLYQRGKNWYIYIIVDGRRIRRSFGEDKNAAKAVLAELQKKRSLIKMGELDVQEFKESLQRKTKAPKFSELADEYLAERAHAKFSTLQGYKSLLKNCLLPHLANQRCDQITEGEIVQLRMTLQRHLSAGSVNNALMLLGAILETATRRRYIKENPTRFIQRLPQSKGASADCGTMCLQELETVLAAVSDNWRPLFIFLAYTGVRPNEAFALKWRDVLEKKDRIRIRAGRVCGVESTPKTKAGIREIPMPPQVKAVLDALRGSRKVIDLDGHVFLSPRGGPINNNGAMFYAWKVALKKVGMEHRRPYELRHGFVTTLLENNLPLNYISRRIGHANTATTMQFYAANIEAMESHHDQRAAAAMSTDSAVDEHATKHATGAARPLIENA